MNVLITGAGTVTCQSVIKGLRSQDEVAVRITTVDPNPQSAGRYFSDAFYTVPLADDPEFLPSLLKIVDRERIGLLIPIVDYEFDTIGRNIPAFETLGCRVAMCDIEATRTANEKDRTFEFFSKHGFSTPTLYSLDELGGRGAESLFPVFLKPKSGRASLDTYKVDSFDELERLVARVDDPIIQEYVTGDEVTIDTLSDFDRRVIAVMPRRRIETKVGVSYKGLTLDDDALVAEAERVAECLGAVGALNMQCFLTDDGPVFFEINPRFSGTLALTLAAGVNSPLLLVKAAMGEKLEPTIGVYKKGLLMLRYWEEVYVESDGTAFAGPKLRLRG